MSSAGCSTPDDADGGRQTRESTESAFISHQDRGVVVHVGRRVRRHDAIRALPPRPAGRAADDAMGVPRPERPVRTTRSRDICRPRLGPRGCVQPRCTGRCLAVARSATGSRTWARDESLCLGTRRRIRLAVPGRTGADSGGPCPGWTEEPALTRWAAAFRKWDVLDRRRHSSAVEQPLRKSLVRCAVLPHEWGTDTNGHTHPLFVPRGCQSRDRRCRPTESRPRLSTRNRLTKRSPNPAESGWIQAESRLHELTIV